MANDKSPVEQRTLWLGSGSDDCDKGINEKHARDITEALFDLNDESHQPILMVICCHGGEAERSIAVADAIELLDAPVVGLVLGCAYSGAIDVLLSCKTRLITPRSTVMFHRTVCSMGRGNVMDAKESLDYLERFDQITLDALTNRCDIPQSVLDQAMRHDVYIDASEAVRYKLVDSIVYKWSEIEAHINQLKTPS